MGRRAALQAAADAVVPGALRRRMAERSYSQAGEDRIASFALGELRIERPTYLDLGAYHPFHLSNTALLYTRGCRGVNVEADPDSLALFRRYRRADVNLNVGVGPEPGRLTFYRMSAATLSTFSKEAADQAVEESGGRHQIVGTVDVDVLTVPHILAGRPVPDFLSLDVEGGDLDIVRSMSTWPALPVVACVETITYSEHGLGVKVQEIVDLMNGLGYMTLADSYINTIFVLRDRWVGH